MEAAIGMNAGAIVQPMSQKKCPESFQMPLNPLFPNKKLSSFLCLHFLAQVSSLFDLFAVCRASSRFCRVLARSSRSPREVLALSSRPRAVLALSSRSPRAVLGTFFLLFGAVSLKVSKKMHILCFFVLRGSEIGSVSGSGPNPAPPLLHSGSGSLFCSRHRDFVKAAGVSRQKSP